MIPFLAVLIAFNSPSPPPDTAAMIQEGIELHDAGDYDAAINIFHDVLELEPENSLARYELTNSHFSAGDFDSCADSAQAGLDLRSEFQASFHMMAGSCHSSSGRTRKALRAFRKGLEVDPGNARLHFNLAITLFNGGDTEAAAEHLESAVSNEPTYPSPYLLLGEYHRQAGSRIPGFFYLTRFFTLESDSTRSSLAATSALGLLSSGIEAKSESEISVTVPALEEGNAFSTLEVGLSLAGALQQTTGAAESPSEAHRAVAAFTTFLQIASEMSGAEDSALRTTTAWKQAMDPVLEVHEKEGSQALGFLMALRAGLEGAEEWLRTNQESLERLSEIVAETRQPGAIGTAEGS